MKSEEIIALGELAISLSNRKKRPKSQRGHNINYTKALNTIQMKATLTDTSME